VGSIIEVFPGLSRRRARADQAWRKVPLPGSGQARVRATRLEDYAALRALQREASPAAPGLTLKQLEAQRNAFPEGQLVAVSAGRIVGSASSLIVLWAEHAANPSWRSVTGDGSFATHDAAGGTLFCAEMIVAGGRGSSAARSLQRAQRRLARNLNLARIACAVPLASYDDMREELSPEEFLERVIWGDLACAELRGLLAEGFQPCGVLRGFMPEDADSCGHAALLVWLNPAYSPTEPPAHLEAVRPRKCA
jgi:hypothetical protein